MSTKGKSQVQRDAEIRLGKLESKMGEGELSFYVLLNNYQKPRNPDGTFQKDKIFQGKISVEKAHGAVRDGFGVIDVEKREYVQDMGF